MWDWAISFLVSGCLLFGIGGVMLINLVADRIFPNGNNQPLATICEVNERIKDKIPDEQKYFGYFEKDGKKYFVVYVLDRRENEIKIGCYGCPNGFNSINFSKGNITYQGGEGWIPKADFHKYYDIQELSDIVTELQKKKK